MTSGSSSGWLQGDVLAEAFELVDEASDLALRVTALVVVAAEVVVDLAGREHVPVGDEDRVFDGAERAAVADPGPEALVLGLQGSCRWCGWLRALLLRGRFRATCSLCGCGRSGVCRRIGGCRGSGRPSWRGGRRRGSGSCRCRSQRP